MERLRLLFLLLIIFSIINIENKVYAESLTVTTTVTITSNVTYDNILVTGTGVLIADGEITVTGDMTIQSGGVVTHSLRLLTGLRLHVLGILDIQAGGMIDVNGKGLLGAPGGNDRLGESYNPVTGTIVKVTPEVNGACYGGLGGGGSLPAYIYGSEVNPTQLGSGGGGGAWSSGQPGANGGGSVIIETDNLIVNGTISANGNSGLPAWPGSGGGGSGGTVNIIADQWSGSGIITANGGNSGNGDGSGGGGGGRIAIRYNEKSYTGTYIAKGGIPIGSGYTAGGAGTIYLKADSQIYGDLILDNEGVVPGWPDAILLSSMGPRTFHSLELKNRGQIVVTPEMSPFTIENNISIAENARLKLKTNSQLNPVPIEFNNGILTSEATYSLTGNSISGIGTFEGSINNGGTINPGSPLGSITITGNYTQLPSGSLNIEVGGTTPVSGYDQLNISGTATLNGTLNVNLINGFVPALDNQFQVVTYGNRTEEFSTINGWNYNTSYLPNNFSLIVGSANIHPVTFNSEWNGSSHQIPVQVCPPWNFDYFNAPILPYFDGDSLVVNSPSITSYTYYYQSGTEVSIPDTLVIEFKMRFVSGGTNDPTRVAAHCYFICPYNTWNVLMIGQDEIFLWSAENVKGPNAFVDTDGGFHTYRIEVFDYQTIHIFYDNNLALIGSTIPTNPRLPEIVFGKTAGNCWGISKWLSFKHNASAVTSTSPVVLSSPANGSTYISLNPTLSWNAHGCATSYDFQFSYDSLFTTTIINDVSITDTSRQIAELSYGTKYYWRVRGKNEGVTGDWSSVWHFTTLPAMPDLKVIQVQVPSTAYSGQSYQVSWGVKNTDLGGTNTPLWHDAVYFSPDSVFNLQLATYLGQFENISYLNPGETYSNSANFTLPQGITGDYYVFVVTDKNNTVYEINETNNHRRNTIAMHVLLTPPPDLQIISLITPDHTFSGQSINVSWEVKNMGTGQTVSNSWSDGVYLSRDTILNIPSATQLGIFSHSGALAPNGSYSKAVSVSIPQAIYGKYYIHVYTDVSNQVYEYVYELNNTRRNDSLTVTLSPPPDLVMTSIEAPSSGSSGQPITISWTVENQGAGQPFESGWNDRVYLTTTPNFDPSFSIVLGDQYRSGTLAAGSAYTVDRTFTIPNGFYGPNYVFIKTDCFNQVFEYTFEDNNMLRSDAAVQIGLSPWPDLQVPFVYAPANAMAGQTVMVTWKVKNEGLATASSSWNDRIYLSTSSTWNPNTIVSSSDVPRPFALLPDSSYTRNSNLALPSNLSGTYYFYVSADIGNNIYEFTDEGNNLAGASAILVEPIPPAPPSDLMAGNLTSSTSGASMQPIEVSWTVTNLGPGVTTASSWTDAVYLSSDTQLDPANDLLLAGFGHNGALNINQQYTRNQSIVLPNDLSGTFYVFLRTDIYYQSNDANWTNNSIQYTNQITITLTPTPDLQVTASSSPAQINSGQPITVEWTVSNNGEGATPASVWYDGIYLSGDPYPDNGDIKLGAMVYTEVLEPASSYSKSMQVEIPIYSSGNNFIIFVTDERNDIYERYAENNNYRTVPINVNMPPPADLIITSMIIPDSAAPGQNVSISWSVENIGQYPAVGWIRDVVYFSADIQWDIDDPALGVISEYINLQPGGKYNALNTFNLEETFETDLMGNITGVMPGITPGMYHVIVRTNIKRNIRESNYDNNILISQDSLKVDIPTLVLGIPVTDNISQGQSLYYRIHVPGGKTLNIHLEGISPEMNNEIYVRYGEVPSRSTFDFSSNEPFKPTQEIVISNTLDGIYYIQTFCTYAQVNPTPYIIQANIAMFGMSSLDITEGGIGGNVTTKITGAEFTPEMIVLLKDDNNVIKDSASIVFVDQATVFAKFHLQTVPLGVYDIVLDKSGTYYAFVNDSINPIISMDSIIQAVANNAFHVVPASGGLSNSTTYPSQLRVGQAFSFAISSKNNSNNDIQSPLLLLYSTPKIDILSPSSLSLESRIHKILLTSGSGSGVNLRPGDFTNLTVYARAPSVTGKLYIQTIRASDSDLSPDIRNDLLALGVENLFSDGDQIINTLEDIVENDWNNYEMLLNEEANARHVESNEYLSIDQLLLYICQRLQSNTKVKMPDFTSFPCPEYQPDFEGECNPDRYASDTEKLNDWIEFAREHGCGLTSADFLDELANGNSTNHEFYDGEGIVDCADKSSQLEDYKNKAIENINNILAFLVDANTQSGEFNGMCFDEVRPFSFRNNYTWNICCMLDLIGSFGGIRTAKVCIDNFTVDVTNNCGRKKANYTATIVIKLCDLYQWDRNDTDFPFIGEAARNVQLCNHQNGLGGSPFTSSMEMRLGFTDSKDLGYDPAADTCCQLMSCDPCMDPTHDPSCDSIPIIRAIDPNDIVGPKGYGDEKWINNYQVIPYMIHYENDSTNASAPAQTVTIEQQLDSDINPNSFRLGSFGFGSFIFNIPENVAFYSQRLDVIDSLGVYVDISAGIDITTNIIFWTFKSIDPTTGLPPTNPLTGFLPVNDLLNRGQGFVNYTIRPKTTSQTGDIINAKAEIVFDINAPIETPEIFNTIDAGDPVSSVNPLPAQSDSTNLIVSWNGYDDAGGCGIGSYQLYTSKDDGPFQVYGQYESDSIQFSGISGSTYKFFSRAKDHVGNTEPLKTSPEAFTYVIGNNRYVNMKAFLEGPYNPASGFMNTTLSVKDFLPLSQPYGIGPWNYQGTERADSIPIDVVDWILVELRDADSPVHATEATKLPGWPRAMFLKKDGTIVDVNGNYPTIQLPVIHHNLYIVIRHRNHIDVMSNFGMVQQGNTFNYNFTTAAHQAFGNNLKQSGNVYLIFVGDILHDGIIDIADMTPLDNDNNHFFNGYLVSDINGDGMVDTEDMSILDNNSFGFVRSVVPW